MALASLPAKEALAKWFAQRVGEQRGRIRRIMVVALARKLLVALWRYVETGLVPRLLCESSAAVLTGVACDRSYAWHLVAVVQEWSRSLGCLRLRKQDCGTGSLKPDRM